MEQRHERPLADEVDTRFANDADLRPFLPAIARQEARELEWLADLWQVDVEFEVDAVD